MNRRRPYLWPRDPNQPASDKPGAVHDAIYHAVCRRTKKAFGEPVNLHLFRDGAATFWALRDPNRVMGVSGLLGHAPRITERHYNQANGISAGRKLADALARQTCTDPAPAIRLK